MASLVYPINLHLSTGQNVRGISNPKPAPLRPLVADTSPRFQLTFLEGDGIPTIADMAGKSIYVGIGNQDPKPENGHWIITNGDKTSQPIPAEASNDEVLSLVNDSGIFPAGVTIKKETGDWIIEHNEPGALPEIGGTFNGTTASSSLSIYRLDLGTDHTHAAYRVQIIQKPAILILPEDWTYTTPRNTSSLTTISTGTHCIYELALDKRIQSGYYQLTINGKTTQPITWSTSAYDLEKILGTMLEIEPATNSVVAQSSQNGFIITLSGSLTTNPPMVELNTENLKIPSHYLTTVEIKSEAIYELLENRTYADTAIEIRLVDNTSLSEASYILPVVIQDPVIRDTPDSHISTPISDIVEYARLYSPYTDLWHPVTAALDENEKPILEIGAGDSIAGKNPYFIKHATTNDLYTLHIGENGSIATTYYGNGFANDLKLKLDTTNHILVQASGDNPTATLTLTSQPTI